MRRHRRPLTVISTGAPAPGRGGVEKSGGRSIDATRQRLWPASVASQISPLAALGRNDGEGVASLEMTGAEGFGRPGCRQGACPGRNEGSRAGCDGTAAPLPSFRPEPRPPAGGAPSPVISTGAPAPGRGGVEKSGGRSIDATRQRLWPASVASQISPLAALGRNDGEGVASLEMTGAEGFGRPGCRQGACPGRNEGSRAGCDGTAAPLPSFRPEPRPPAGGAPSPVISTGAPAPGRGGVEKSGGRSIDATRQRLWPASVASQISPLAALGRNDGEGSCVGRNDGGGAAGGAIG